MLSIPPAIITFDLPAVMLFAAIIAASNELPQTLLIVVAPIDTGKPAPRATCLAGFCPQPACNT